MEDYTFPPYYSEDSRIIGELTDEQRWHVYQQEKLRRAQTAPLISKRGLAMIAIYIFGFLLTYSGILTSLDEFPKTHKWVFQPESHFPQEILNAVITLARPFFAVALVVIVAGWCIIIPVSGLFSLLYFYGGDVIRWLKKFRGER